MMRSRCRALSRTYCRYSPSRSGRGVSPDCFCSTSVKPMIAFSGVRSSWLILARKRSLARPVATDTAMALRSASSCSLRSVTSRWTEIQKRGQPWPSLTGAMSSSTQNRSPNLVWLSSWARTGRQSLSASTMRLTSSRSVSSHCRTRGFRPMISPAVQPVFRSNAGLT